MAPGTKRAREQGCDTAHRNESRENKPRDSPMERQLKDERVRSIHLRSQVKLLEIDRDDLREVSLVQTNDRDSVVSMGRAQTRLASVGDGGSATQDGHDQDTVDAQGWPDRAVGGARCASFTSAAPLSCISCTCPLPVLHDIGSLDLSHRCAGVPRREQDRMSETQRVLHAARE